VDTPRPSPRTNRTRRAPHPVLIGHAASLSQDDENDANGGSGAAAEGGGAEQRGGGEGGEDADEVEGWVQREGGDVEMVPVPRQRRLSEDPGGLPGRVPEEDPSTPSPTAPARVRPVQGRD
jgi:hypothetical protein